MAADAIDVHQVSTAAISAEGQVCELAASVGSGKESSPPELELSAGKLNPQAPWLAMRLVFDIIILVDVRKHSLLQCGKTVLTRCVMHFRQKYVAATSFFHFNCIEQS